MENSNENDDRRMTPYGDYRMSRRRDDQDDAYGEHRTIGRGHTRGYAQEYSYMESRASSQSEDWKCLECAFWNEGRDKACRRCHADPSSRRRRSPPTRDYYHHSTGSWEEAPNRSVGEYEDGISFSKTNDAVEELDEFGRIKAPTTLAVKKTRWPPCFETHGSSFVLDARSGMFYEAVSDFFYDPKSQLYYGNQQGAYFRYDATKRAFDAVPGSTAESTAENTAVASEEGSTTKKVSISINLKTRVLPSEGSKAPIAKKAKKDKSPKEIGTILDVAAAVVIPKKQHAVDIEKWSERQQEIRSVVEPKKIASAQPSAAAKTDPAVPTTTKGEPICLLCRRRFPSLEKLRHHEAASALHKENLAKQQLQSSIENAASMSAKEAPPSEASSTYVDRAEQRRQMHQYSTDLSMSRIETPINTNTMISEPVDPKRNLDETNIGHQMLQKLGWKSGDGLGRDAEAAVNIQQDWDRIEATLATTSNAASNRKGIGS